MENKINIAELLKDCPQGMELDCASYDNVSFDKISDDKNAVYPIFCYITNEEGNRSGISFTENGCESKRYGAKCVIFPKGKTTWEGFHRPFKDGDVVKGSLGVIAIVSNAINSKLYNTHCVLYKCGSFIIGDTRICLECFATEEEKQKLFDAIKANGYKWNTETKTLEKLIKPKFKVGDRIVHKRGGNPFTITEIINGCYKGGTRYAVLITQQDNFELTHNKFNINTLKPFDKVLVRDNDKQKWVISFFSHCNGLEFYKYSCINGSGYVYCIPYENNEHLLGTTNDCDDFYKT